MKNKKFFHLSNSLHASSRAFTLIEMLIVLLTAILILAIAINNFPKQRKIYTYQQYISELETAVRMAKLKAVERSVNVSICPVNNSIVVYDKGSDRSYPCDGNGKIIYTINIDNSIATVKGSGFSFDPRGLGIIGGNICIQSADGSMYYKILVQSLSGRINIQKGSGGC
ncbi:MAG: GspH/FimT family pseudopilin [Sulfurihydrogenibium sp.]|jgi:Tfp pilus assembly protein FimT|nr:GspH/FimT family pseudopilin [Sulfurihydrogenibium sp.]